MNRLNLILPLMLLVFTLLCLSFVACGDDDDDDDDNDTEEADDDTEEEDPCVTEAKTNAEIYCDSVGMVANLQQIGIGTSGAECGIYCGGNEYTLDYDCKDGLCICCM